MTASVVATVRVPATPADAFRQFVRELGEWWPREYTWSGAVLEQIGIEPHVGGFCFEVGPFGFRCAWGRVLHYEPDGKIAFYWQIGPTRVPEPDPARASEVCVTFTAPDGPGTTVRLEHTGFEKHGEGAEDYRSAMDSEHGWPYVLQLYAAHVARRQ